MNKNQNTMTTEQLKTFFEERDFNVHLHEQDGVQCAEVEKWTDGGVDMIIGLVPFTKEEFIEYVNDFDVDEHIEITRQDKSYRAAFTIRQGLDDFTAFHNHLKEVVESIQSAK